MSTYKTSQPSSRRERNRLGKENDAPSGGVIAMFIYEVSTSDATLRDLSPHWLPQSDAGTFQRMKLAAPIVFIPYSKLCTSLQPNTSHIISTYVEKMFSLGSESSVYMFPMENRKMHSVTVNT